LRTTEGVRVVLEDDVVVVLVVVAEEGVTEDGVLLGVLDCTTLLGELDGVTDDSVVEVDEGEDVVLEGNVMEGILTWAMMDRRAAAHADREDQCALPPF
jgi:hypothetical protein